MTDPDSPAQGAGALRDPIINKGTAFTEAERDALGLRGLLPPRVFTLDQQVERVLESVRRKNNPLEKYIYLMSLQDRNETLFFRVVINNLEEMMPIIYTPTVGQACLEYGHIFRRPRGLYITLADRGHVSEIIHNWFRDDVRVIVVTDGERILGLGDLGAQGMGIPVGKLALYVACAGIHPDQCLPIVIDVGTDNERLLQDPLYIGTLHERVRGEAYDALIEEFVQAVMERYPNALLQFEDFGNTNAFRLLHHYRERICTFNDDIQGTAAVTVAGLFGALRITGGALRDQRLLFLGAGEAGIGIGDLMTAALEKDGLPAAEGRQRCWFVDSRGLVVASRTDLAEHKRPYAHDHAEIHTFTEAVARLRPTAIIGVSGQPGAFTPEILGMMAAFNERPIIFALSNPTSKSECTAEQAYAYTNGKAVFASGSPFDPVTLEGQIFVPGQANNAYIFPGVGLGVTASRAAHVSDEMFSAAAETLARLASADDLAQGRVFPPLREIRRVSLEIGIAVAEVAYAQGVAREPHPADLRAFVAAKMYQPVYEDSSG
jgi:malate dehydrogenase (oxaloacetate-decarboxylating)(NADP+)